MGTIFNVFNVPKLLNALIGTRLSYFDNTGDDRLKQIVNQGPNKANLSQFGYTYKPTAEIVSLATPAKTYQLSYDADSQLTGAAASDGGTFAYAYDAAGNRISEAINSQVNPAGYSNTNQLLQSSSQQFAYDANGNLLTDGTRAFEWDARNRLTAVNIGTHRSEFSYDAADRRSRIVEKESGVIVNDKELIWCGGSVCEERDSAAGLNKRFFAQGETQISGGNETPYYYTRDHLGSVREVTDSTGAIVASFDYDPWGRPVQLSGTLNAAFGYAGYYAHGPSGLYLTQYRAYDPNLGRWLSRDPLGEIVGLNVYAYADNDPLAIFDPDGLSGVGKAIILGIRGAKILRKGLGFRDLVRLMQEGEDVSAASRKLAHDIAKEAGGGRPPIHDKPHGPVEEGYRPHYHTWDRSGGHVFYSFAAALTFSHYSQGYGPVGQGVGFVVDIFNPLSIVKDVLDIYGEFAGDAVQCAVPEGTTPGVINWLAPDAGNSTLFQ
jgi:RHS repeat-associated protein